MQLGGIDIVRLIHRYTGIIFSAVALTHIMIAIIGITLKKWAPSMLISKGLQRCCSQYKVLPRIEDHPASCDRYSYRQDLNTGAYYWGRYYNVLVLHYGFVVITQFLPEVIGGKVLHTNQAILIFVMIALLHICNSIFSPEVFPQCKHMQATYQEKDGRDILPNL
jgi:hypothetical protein